MTRTTEHEYHPDRPVIHFGSPAGAKYWREKVRPIYREDKPERRKRER